MKVSLHARRRGGDYGSFSGSWGREDLEHMAPKDLKHRIEEEILEAMDDDYVYGFDYPRDHLLRQHRLN